MVNEQEILANGRKTTDNMDNDATRTHAHNSEIVSPVSNATAAATKTVAHSKRITREATNPIRISGLSNQNHKNGKSENAKRSEPNIGQVPGRPSPASAQSGKGYRLRSLALIVSAIYRNVAGAYGSSIGDLSK